MCVRKGIPKWRLEERSKQPEAEKCACGRTSLNLVMPIHYPHPNMVFMKIELCWLNNDEETDESGIFLISLFGQLQRVLGLKLSTSFWPQGRSTIY